MNILLEETNLKNQNLNNWFELNSKKNGFITALITSDNNFNKAIGKSMKLTNAMAEQLGILGSTTDTLANSIKANITRKNKV